MGRHRQSVRRLAGLGGLTLLLALLLPAFASAQRRLPPATTSSPIALSDDGRYVWNVNQRADIVTVIRASSGDIVRRINTGDEPAAVALHPNGRYAYVVNPA